MTKHEMAEKRAADRNLPSDEQYVDCRQAERRPGRQRRWCGWASSCLDCPYLAKSPKVAATPSGQLVFVRQR
jgi:hypothetical protein